MPASKIRKVRQTNLFQGFLKRRTSETTGDQIAEAAATRKKQEAHDLEALAEKANLAKVSALATSTLDDSTSSIRKIKPKELSSNPDAVRKRLERLRKKNRKAPRLRQEESIDLEKQVEKKEPIKEVEGETHYVDSRGRTRKRKRLRSISVTGSAGRVGPKGKRRFLPTEVKLILDEHARAKARGVGTVNYGLVARELQKKHPAIFGVGAPGFDEDGLSRQAVRVTVLRAQKRAEEAVDGRGRPTALPESVVSMIIAVLTSVVNARTTIMSAPMLQPVAIGVIIAAGHGELLNEGRKRRGLFCCSLHYVRALMKERGWKCVRPQGDTRKLPDGWAMKRWQMVLRLAYFVFVHMIPKALVINADHTGIMFTQVCKACACESCE